MRSVVEEIKTITDGKKSYKQFNTEYSGKLKVLSNRGFNGRRSILLSLPSQDMSSPRTKRR